MKLNLAVKTLLVTLALSAALPLAAVAESTSASMKQNSSGSNSTQFICRSYYDERSGNEYPATFAAVGNQTSKRPLLVWRTNYFGGNFDPETRCNIVSQRFTDAVSFNGGRLQGLELTHGTVNSETVICVVRFYGDQCTEQNMLFTLRPENARRAGGILSQIKEFSQGYSDVPPVYESGGEQVYVNLADMLEPELGSSGSGSSGSYQQEDNFPGGW